MVGSRSEAEFREVKEEIPHDHLFRVTGLSSGNLEKMGQGMITSALMWGFLSDTLGRRKIMMWGFLAAGFVELGASLSQNYAMLLVTRFTAGFLFNGPFATLLSYIAEMHRTELRAKTILLTNFFYTFASIILPLLAWGLLSRDVDLHIIGDILVVRSWNLFLFCTGLVPLLTGVAFIFMPESPKFLMSRGRNEEALAIFRRMYAMNIGKPENEYPILILVKEKSLHTSEGAAALREGMSQIAPLFQRPLGPWLLLLCIIHIGTMFGSNTLRLWYPQMAAMITATSNETLCSAIVPTNTTLSETCVATTPTMMAYVQSAIVGMGSIVTYGMGSVLVDRCGKKVVSGVCTVTSAVLVTMVPFLETGAYSVLAMVTSALAFTSLSTAALSNIIVDLFPTGHRVMAMATFMMCGRLGTICGTIAFPALLELGCYVPFVTIGAVLIICGLAYYVVPNTTLKKLE